SFSLQLPMFIVRGQQGALQPINLRRGEGADFTAIAFLNGCAKCVAVFFHHAIGDGFWVGLLGRLLSKSMKKLAGTTRLELATSAVTGQRSNQLNYVPSFVGKVQIQAFVCWADCA